MSLLSEEIARVYEEIARVTALIDPSGPASNQYIFTWQGKDYTALSVVEVKGNLFGAGGFTADNHLTITARIDVFASGVPGPEQFVIYKDHRYRIDVTEPSPDGSGIVLKCNDPDRGTGIVHREM